MARPVSVLESRNALPDAEINPAAVENMPDSVLLTTLLQDGFLSRFIFILPIQIVLSKSPAPHKCRNIEILTRLLFVRLAENVRLRRRLGYGNSNRLGFCRHFDLGSIVGL
jgi:hypothetical protein